MSSANQKRQALLKVKDEQMLDEFGRFFRAMLLDLLREPGKERMLRKMDVSVAIEPVGHPESALTLTFRGGRVMLESGAARNVDVRLKCTVITLMKLARVPAGPRALKFMMGPVGKDLLASMRAGDLKVRGIARHPRGMMGFSRFLSPVESRQEPAVGRGYAGAK